MVHAFWFEAFHQNSYRRHRPVFADWFGSCSDPTVRLCETRRQLHRLLFSDTTGAAPAERWLLLIYCSPFIFNDRICPISVKGILTFWLNQGVLVLFFPHHNFFIFDFYNRRVVFGQFARDDQQREFVEDHFLYESFHGAGTELRIKALLGQQSLG